MCTYVYGIFSIKFVPVPVFLMHLFFCVFFTVFLSYDGEILESNMEATKANDDDYKFSGISQLYLLRHYVRVL